MDQNKELQEQLEKALLQLKLNTPKRRERYNLAIRYHYSPGFAAIYAVQEG